MTRTVFLLLALAVPAAAGLPDLVVHKLPVSVGSYVIRTPLAAVCQDGAVWLCWWQASPPYGRPSVTSDKGVYVRKFSPTGQDIVPPTRVVAPENASHTFMALYPDPYYFTATPAGDAVIFMHEHPGPERSSGKPPTGRVEDALVVVANDLRPYMTSVVHVSRSGRVSRLQLGFAVGASSSTRGNEYRPAGIGGVSVAFDSSGSMHCLLGGMQGDACYSRIRVDADGLSLIAQHRFALIPRQASTPGLVQFDSTNGFLRGLFGDRVRTAIAFLGGDTMVAIHANSAAKGRELRVDARDTELSIYRFSATTLQLLDSIRVGAASLGGVLNVGSSPRGAAIHASPRGLRFSLPATEGMASYELNDKGNPVGGNLTSVPVRMSPQVPVEGHQLVDFARYGYLKPWVIEWYGLHPDGTLSYQRVVTDSVVGRIE